METGEMWLLSTNRYLEAGWGGGGGVTIEGRDGNQWMSIVKTGF